MSNLTIIEYQNKRVLTTQQLAEAYETEVTNIQTNFNTNKERFLVGRDYYKLEGESLKDFKRLCSIADEPSIKFAPQLIIWTQRGANRHCKILDTDKAWQQFDVLEETYFNVKNTKPLSQLEILAQSAQILLEQDRAIKQVAADVQGIRDIVAMTPENWRTETSHLLNKAASKLGGYDHLKDIRNESYKLLDERMRVDVQQRLTNKKNRMAGLGVCKSKWDKLNPLDVIDDDPKLVEGYIAIVKELAIKYGA